MSLIPQSGVSSPVPLYLSVPPIGHQDPLPPRKCDASTSKLFAQVYQDFRNVVKNMGGDPNQVAVDHELQTPYYSDWPDAVIFPPYKLSINLALLNALNGCDVPYTRQTALGILAHEAAHRILKHTERLRIERVRFECEECNELLRSYEKEADLLTMRVPFYARGVRDYVCNRLPFQQDYYAIVDLTHPPGMDNTHPSDWTRCRYMTDALCDQHPEENQDICPKPV